eukprot:SAG25_NODE_287_length_10351_cov_22.194499_9_plen_75_part_00
MELHQCLGWVESQSETPILVVLSALLRNFYWYYTAVDTWPYTHVSYSTRNTVSLSTRTIHTGTTATVAQLYADY